MAHSTWGGYDGAVPSVWLEGSFGAVLYLRRGGRPEEAAALANNRFRGQNGTGGFDYAMEEDKRYEMVTHEAMGATAWAVLATALRRYMWPAGEVQTPDQVVTLPAGY